MGPWHLAWKTALANVISQAKFKLNWFNSNSKLFSLIYLNVCLFSKFHFCISLIRLMRYIAFRPHLIAIYRSSTGTNPGIGSSANTQRSGYARLDSLSLLRVTSVTCSGFFLLRGKCRLSKKAKTFDDLIAHAMKSAALPTGAKFTNTWRWNDFSGGSRNSARGGVRHE